MNGRRGQPATVRLIYTAPQEFFLTQMKVALFGAMFIAFPVIATQIYKFVAPGLYKNERRAFLPYLIATPLLFMIGAMVVFFVLMPLAMRFFLSLEQKGGPGQASIELLPKVNEYLSLIMTLILAFGLVFQLPVVLTLLARIGIVTSDSLKRERRYAIVLRLHRRGDPDAAGHHLPARPRRSRRCFSTRARSGRCATWSASARWRKPSARRARRRKAALPLHARRGYDRRNPPAGSHPCSTSNGFARTLTRSPRR